VLPFDPSFAIGFDLNVQIHRVSADRTFLDIVLMGPG